MNLRLCTLIDAKLWNPFWFIYSKLLLLNFTHAERLPNTESLTLYFKPLFLKSNPGFSVLLAPQEKRPQLNPEKDTS